MSALDLCTWTEFDPDRLRFAGDISEVIDFSDPFQPTVTSIHFSSVCATDIDIAILSACLSVRLSRSGIGSKRLNTVIIKNSVNFVVHCL